MVPKKGDRRNKQAHILDTLNPGMQPACEQDWTYFLVYKICFVFLPIFISQLFAGSEQPQGRQARG